MSKAIKVKDLQDQILTTDRSFLLCRVCGAHNSANAGDYWNTPDDHIFKCCNANMVRVVRYTTYVEV
jgi:hypothetical protein